MSANISMWYKKGLNSYLSSLGFKHFSTGDAVTDDFKEGRAFMINVERKTFGLKDMISRDDIADACALSEEFVLTGKINHLCTY